MRSILHQDDVCLVAGGARTVGVTLHVDTGSIDNEVFQIAGVCHIHLELLRTDLHLPASTPGRFSYSRCFELRGHCRMS